MKAWYLCENPYPFVPEDVLNRVDSVRASLPNQYCDPRLAAQLYDECLDEYLVCDDVGVNILSNEHHAGINCLYPTNAVILGALARQTRNARLLSLGTLITVRPDPVRVAEEYAMIDVISRGRLEIGFVKSGGTELASGDASPTGLREREWEAIDLILKALTTRNGPFRWEGKYYSHEHVNIWPRPWQQPHPPLWAATADDETASELGARDIINAIFISGVERTRQTWDAYKRSRLAAGLGPARTDRFAYMAFTYVGDTDEEGIRVGSKSLWFLNVGSKSAAQYDRYLPGQIAPRLAPPVYRTALPPNPTVVARPGASPEKSPAAVPRILGHRRSAEQLIEQGLMFAGNPDSVFQQIQTFYDQVGGFEHLILMGRSGFMTHQEAEKGIKLFGKEVLPRLAEIGVTVAEQPTDALTTAGPG